MNMVVPSGVMNLGPSGCPASGPSSVASNPPTHPRAGLSPISPAASLGHYSEGPGAHRGPGSGATPGPPPYELPSPASNASSYLNRNLNSVEAPTPIVRAPEASSLIVNILLADSLLNIFKDHNFDSCTLCVCNAGSKVVGNIRGADAGLYLPDMAQDDESIRCTCGFSAVINRKLSYQSGLFCEDEMEITGIVDDMYDRKKTSLLMLNPKNQDSANNTSDRDTSVVDEVPQNIVELIREQCVIIRSSSNALCRATKLYQNSLPERTCNLLEFMDGNEVTFTALEQGRQSMDSMGMCKVDETQKNMCMHKWPFLRAKGPHCSQDIVRVMKALQPLLQEAVQKKCTARLLWEAPYKVAGPLTWRQFHRLAGRGENQSCYIIYNFYLCSVLVFVKVRITER